MKSGFVTIIGRPSSGKSTLLNALCGEKVAITSKVPQTTRNAIRGIVNRAEGQIVFLDTPGYHQSNKKLNIYLKDVVHRSLADTDAVLYLVDATRHPGPEEKSIMELLAESGKTIVGAVNKTDLETPLLPEIRGLIQANLAPKILLNVSGITGSNLEPLVDAIMEVCPEGEPHYPKDFYTDQVPEFRISEIIREQAILRSEQEVPHALYVEIADMEFRVPDETEPTKRTLWVRAFLVVERKSQVGILVGHQGQRIKAIRIGALKELKKIFTWKIRLDLRVKVSPKWRRKDPLLKRILGPGD